MNNTSPRNRYLNYWGKARPEADAPSVSWHPAAYHSLDVAAAGYVILSRDHALRRRLSQQLGLPDAVIPAFVAALLAVHDLGKFTPAFQILVPEIAELQLGWTSSEGTAGLHHDSFGHELACTRFHTQILNTLLRIQTSRGPGLTLARMRPLYAAVCGHHGRPPSALSSDLSAKLCPPDAAIDIEAYINDLTSVVSLPPLDYDQLPRRLQPASWLLSGLTVLADWIGSNQAWFPYTAPTLTLGEYWQRALERADHAVEAAGVRPPPLAAPMGFSALFPGFDRPTPLQALAESAPLPEAPQIHIIEELTGGGKTEAAIMLAHRMMSMGLGDGIYFALPTMATANGMAPRLREIYPRLYDLDSPPEMLVVHSAAALAERLASLTQGADDQPYGGGPDTASATARSWLADGRKKSLLAPIGVGTIDQALLGILNTRHSTLRLLGLHRHVLIVDEVHACDHYMHTLLSRLLMFQGALGGSAILLSATLPKAQREALVAAFREGAGAGAEAEIAAAEGAEAEGTEAEISADYPLLTTASAAGVHHTPFEAGPLPRHLHIEHLDDEAAVIRTLIDASEAGQCAAWIRNTVGEATQAWQRLRDHVPAERLTLFHGRFALGDRRDIEAKVLSQFGKRADPSGRAGQIVIATQVIEQSLDVDFDVMVSDLAPIDLILQRAGRLQRHPRRRDGALSEDGRDHRGPLRLRVYGPAWTDDPDAAWLGRGSAHALTGLIYPHHGELWLTLKALRSPEGLHLPAQARALIESVYDAGTRQIPGGLLHNADLQAGEQQGQTSCAELAQVKLSAGYLRTQGQTWSSEERAMTRLGEPTARVRLVTQAGEGWRPLISGPEAAPDLGWPLSELTVRLARISGSGLPEATEAAVKAQMLPDKGRWVIPVVLSLGDNGVWYGSVVDGGQQLVQVRYDHQRGLRFEGDLENE